MKSAEHKRLCDELRLGNLKPGYELATLFVDARKSAFELSQFVEAITEGYTRICADNKLMREMLDKVNAK